MNRRVATVFIDALMLFLLVLVILPHKPDEARATSSVDIFSKLIVGAKWPDGTSADVDLWVRSPGGSPVGYSRTRGQKSSLIWDDIGQVNDPPWRYEAVMVRSAPDGEYIINLHLYRGVAPVDVEIAVWRRLPEGESEIWSGVETLTEQGQELTVVRFRLKDGALVPGSVHDRFLPLRGNY